MKSLEGIIYLYLPVWGRIPVMHSEYIMSNKTNLLQTAYIYIYSCVFDFSVFSSMLNDYLFFSQETKSSLNIEYELHNVHI